MVLLRKEIRSKTGEIEHIETSLTGRAILNEPRLNKGEAFTQEERIALKLVGYLPNRVETLEQQVIARYKQLQEKSSPLQKNIFLNALNDYNETLFYRLVSEHLEELIPIIYTPTIGEAVERFSHEIRRPRGLFLAYPERDKMDVILKNHARHDIDVIIVTDGEGVLGIGDQGIGAINIAIGKLMVYTLCAGINPNRVLPIQLDVGTNNHALLNDRQYLGWRHSRITGQKYDDFIQQFTETVHRFMPNTYLHWEDFGRDNARRILEKYRQDFCTFNDDIQGTGMVAAANVMAATAAIGTDMLTHRVVILGAGTAGVGIVDQLCNIMIQAGLSEAQARACFWLVDRQGLLTEAMDAIVDFQRPYLRHPDELKNWHINNPDHGITLADVVHNVHPTILIGCSTVKGAFTEEIVKDMAKHVKKPIIMPLSNPNSHSEADPIDLMQWTDGKVLMACGSPYPPVEFNGKYYRVAQGNNAFVYPGLGLGVIVAKAKRVTDAMLYAACEALSQSAPVRKDCNAPLLPTFSEVRNVSRNIAKAVVAQAIKDGVAQVDADQDGDVLISRVVWEAKYYPFRRAQSGLV